MTNLYISGPQEGRGHAGAADRLRQAGYEVTSPHEFEETDLRAALERSVDGVLDADGVALLDGWESCPGSVVEALTATSQGKPASRVAEWLKAAGVALVAWILVSGVGGSPAVSSEPDRRDRSIMAAEKRERIQERRQERHLEREAERLKEKREHALKRVLRALDD